MYSVITFFFFTLSPAFAALCNSAQWSDPERLSILSAHNALRSSIAAGNYYAKNVRMPSASNMMKMVYDCALEATAQSYANTCPRDHSGIQNVGENMFFIKAILSGRRAAEAWASQFHQYGWPSVKLTFAMANMGIGEATQMAWSSSNRVGCGIARCNDRKSAVVVCHYKPQGNFIGKNIYQFGRTCSACPLGSSCEASTGLCVQTYFK